MKKCKKNAGIPKMKNWAKFTQPNHKSPFVQPMKKIKENRKLSCHCELHVTPESSFTYLINLLSHLSLFFRFPENQNPIPFIPIIFICSIYLSNSTFLSLSLNDPHHHHANTSSTLTYRRDSCTERWHSTRVTTSPSSTSSTNSRPRFKQG